MTRHPRHSAQERLAKLLRDAYLSAYVAGNPHHDAPEWEEVKEVARQGFRLVAAELLALGVKPPLEDS